MANDECRGGETALRMSACRSYTGRSPSVPSRYTAKPLSRQKGTVVIIEHFAPDTYGLLILAPEIALGSGWLGGDRVVGRAVIRELLVKATRFSEDERQRLNIYLPGTALTLPFGQIERFYGTEHRSVISASE